MDGRLSPQDTVKNDPRQKKAQELEFTQIVKNRQDLIGIDPKPIQTQTIAVTPSDLDFSKPVSQLTFLKQELDEQDNGGGGEFTGASDTDALDTPDAMKQDRNLRHMML